MPDHTEKPHFLPHPVLNILQWGVWPLLFVSAYWIALRITVTELRFWDDEGYFLFVLGDFFAHAPLYSGNSNIYGPLYYQTLDALRFWAGFEPIHDHSRAYNAFCWALSAVLSGLSVRLAVRSMAWGLAAFALSFRILTGFELELMHPSALVMVCAAAFLLLFSLNWRSALWWIASGSLVGFLLMVKMNTGIFFGAALWWMICQKTLEGRTRLLALMPVLILPFVVVRSFTQLSYWVFGTVITAALLMLWLEQGLPAVKKLPSWWRCMVLSAAGMLSVIFFSLGLLALGGEHPAQWFDETMLAPAREMIHNVTFRRPVGWPAWYLSAMALSFTLQRVTLIKFEKELEEQATFWMSVAALIMAGVLLFFACEAWEVIPKATVPLSGLSSIPVFLVALAGWLLIRLDPSRFAWAAVIVTLFGSLQMVPIAGAQVSFANFPSAIVAVLLARAGCGGLQAAWPPTTRRFLPRAAAAAGLILAIPWILHRLERDHLTVPLDLPGASTIRCAPQDAAAYRYLSRFAAESELRLVTLPTLNSLHLFAGQSPPAPQFARAYVSLTLPAADVDPVYRSIGVPMKTLFVVRKEALAAWFNTIDDLKGFLAASPAYAPVRDWKGPVYSIGPFTVFVPKGTSLPTGHAQLQPDGQDSGRLAFRLLLDDDERSATAALLVTPWRRGLSKRANLQRPIRILLERDSNAHNTWRLPKDVENAEIEPWLTSAVVEFMVAGEMRVHSVLVSDGKFVE